MSRDPYHDINRLHAEVVDAPWDEPESRHQFRAGLSHVEAARHLNADDFDDAGAPDDDAPSWLLIGLLLVLFVGSALLTSSLDAISLWESVR